MDTRSSILILQGSLLAGIAIAVLALAADSASFFNSHRDSTVDVHYTRWNQTAEAQYSYWLKLDYAPSQFTLGKEQGEIAAGAVCAIIGLVVGVGAWFARGQPASQAAGPVKKRFLPVALGLSGIAFILSLAITIFAWQNPMKWSINFKNSIPLPPVVSNPDQEAPTEYKSPFAYTPELWNCLLSPYVVGAPSGRMQSLCSEAKVAKYLMVPLVIMAAFLVGTAGWMTFKAKKSAADQVEMSAGKDVDEISVNTAGGEVKN